MSEATIGVVVGGARLDAEIGRGGMGVVYRGFQIALNRTVAVKVVRGALASDEEFRQRFRRECEIAAALEHPHIVPIYSADSDAGQLSVTMRYVDGPDLGAFLRERGRLQPAFTAEVVAQTAGALDTAHRQGLVHRDVKPANILVGTADGRPHTYLTDFGLSRATADPRGLTGTGVLLGTPGYMAPEQYEDGEVDARVDVYALGCVLFQCLTGRMPFVRDTAPALMWAHFSESPPALGSLVPGLPDRLDGVVRRAMAKRPEDRFPTTVELARAFSEAAGSAGPRTPGPSSPHATTTVVPPPVIPAPRSAPGPWSGAPTGAPPMSVPPTGVPPISSPQVGSLFARGGQTPAPGTSWPPGAPPASWPPTGSTPPTPRRRPRWLTAGVPLAAVALVVLLAATVLPLVASNGVGRIVGAPVPIGRNALDVEPGAGFIWTANNDDGTISKIDPTTMSSQTIQVGGTPYELVIDGGAVWVNNWTDSVTRVDIATGAVTTVYTNQPAAISSIAAGDGFLWISHRDANVVTRIDMARQAADPTPPFPVGRAPMAMVYANHRLYVANSGDRSLSVLTPDGQSVVGGPLTFSSDVGGMEIDGGTLYVVLGDVNAPADQVRFTMRPIDTATLTVGPQIDLGAASWFDVGRGVGWAAFPFTNDIRRIDLATGAPSGDPITGIGANIGAMQVVSDDLWVTNVHDNTATRVELDA
ncbi:protein kinase domain-containing protein [Actinomycetospora lemnae]|uniref:non-specific serine/threonine protein kinase n=1 Tax=Actinomycetospora lemnae TaxID=3019891 RepID=A0ABT5SRR6_9PSEU|nr:protein kinase [Actinomycetospora sp. DW7H6]MDD7964846.1 protein kinase [Actinomycetospora sp. DW7H6]